MPRSHRLTALLSAAALVLALLPAAALAAAEPASPARIQPWLQDALTSASPTAQMLAIVHAGDRETQSDGELLSASLGAIAAVGMTRVTVWDSIGVAVGRGTPAQVRAVAEVPGVTYVEGDQPLEYRMDTSHKATRYEDARSYPPFVAAAGGVPLDGRGSSVAIVDSGIDGAVNPMFQWNEDTRPPGSEDWNGSKVVRNLEVACLINVPDLCVVDDTTNLTDTNSGGGHGTHVSGTVAGVDVTTTDGRQLHGAAPGAELIGLSTGAVIAVVGSNSAIEWVIDHHEDPCEGNVTSAAVGAPTSCWPITSTNHSYGPVGGGEYNPNGATELLQDELVSLGITNNWAAGNDGGDGSTDNVSPYAKSPTPGVLGVAAYDDTNTGTRDGLVSDFSSRGENGTVEDYPDISAPGTDITSACSPTLVICQSAETDQNYGTISGTSMATPHVAGYVAVLQQAARPPTEPEGIGLDPAEIEDVLEDTAYKFSDGDAYDETDPRNTDDEGTSFDKGHGLVNMAAALGELLGEAPPPIVEGPACVIGEPQVTDPEGDASAFIIELGVQQANDPALDIISAQVSSDDAGNVLFDIRVEDLQEAPSPTAGEGELFDFNFSYDGHKYYVQPSRTSTDEQYVLGDFGGPNGTRRNLANLSGSFDAETDIVRTILPPDAIANSVAPGPVVTAGSTFFGFEIVSRRQVVALVPNADSAVGACPFTVGAQAPPTVSIGDRTLSEGDEGTAPARLPVTLSRGSDETITVRYATADGSATAPEDYVAESATVTFPPGSTRQDVAIDVNGDTTEEPDEAFTVQLSEPSGATIARRTGTVTITNDDDDDPSSEPRLSVDGVGRTEGTGGDPTPFDFAVRLSRSSAETVTVTASTEPGSATAPGDYASTTTEVTFDPGEREETVTVLVEPDAVAEADETFTLVLSAESGAAVSERRGQGTILDDDADPAVSTGDVRRDEGDQGTTTFSFPITLSEAAEQEVRVDYATSFGSAGSDDLTATSGTLVIPAGQTSATVDVAVRGDRTVEPDEGFLLQLSNPRNASLDDSRGVGTILNDDTDVAIGDATLLEGDQGTRPMSFLVSLSGPSDEPVTVKYTTEDGSATAPADYRSRTANLTIPAGKTSARLSISVVGDTVDEDDEAFVVRLLGATGARVTDGEGTGTIQDDDEPAAGGGGTATPTASPTASPAASPTASPGPVDRDDTVSRLSGAGRIQTAVELSREAFPDGAEVAVLARADKFPDALAAAPLASEVEGPVLLTGTDFLDADTGAELDRLGVSRVYLAGGTAALAQRVADDVTARQIAPERLGGANRFATAGLIGDEVVDEGGAVSQVVLARGDAFPDALASGALAMAARAPILLVAVDDVPDETGAALDRLLDAGDAVFVAGGTAAIEPVVATDVVARGLDVQRRGGATRFGTAVALVEEAVDQGAGVEPTVLASGYDFPDALTAGPAAQAMGGSLILVDPAGLDRSPETRDYLTASAEEIDTVFIAGGAAAVDESVDAAVRALIEDG